MTDSRYSIKTPYSQLIRSIAIKMKLSSDEKVKKLGLNSGQGRMIGYIYEHQDNGIIQKDLARAFQRTEASITSMLQGLEKKGYIERRIPKENERLKYIYVLPKGAELIEDFNKSVVEEEENIIASLTEQEKETLLALLLKVDRNL
ncbi:MarR family winged helix-turn-helix transcriptional regulator [Clostridium scatologenes]|uniref:Transcriptional regulator, MarR family n=1 Tax=Clostridium scatologenes TaxID=1548 RepID=A0A0E3K278_CLOSL|nr:MarR family transcriptional regulator [Clostridium scatologenes]AKA70564.1 transcriptional regulator, MarR family [Clostridium scatologenes]